MARRTNFSSVINQMAREQARRQREEERQRKAATRERERIEKEALRQKAVNEKEAKLRYLEERAIEVDNLNLDLKERNSELSRILEYTFDVDDRISFSSLLKTEDYPTFSPPADLDTPTIPPEEQVFIAQIKPLGFVDKLIPGAKSKYEKALLKAQEAFQEAYKRYIEEEENRKEQINQLKGKYEIERQTFINEVREWNQKVTDFQLGYDTGDPAAIISYNSMVLERSEYPLHFPQEFRLAYSPDSKELAIEYELPNTDIIPNISEYRYTKLKDLIEKKPRKPAEIKDLYQDIVASVSLRTIHEVFEADQGCYIDLVLFNGFVQTVDPATGKDIRPYLISVRTSKEKFIDIDLARIDKKACLRNLGAQVSPKASEMQAVKPIMEFNMVDNRFVEQSDVIADLESRQNLMDLTPFEFENLVSNLFQRMGLDTKLTRSSKDGGVDAIAFDTRPILGGKVIIQAKRYKNVVGVSAVRDLYGTMVNEGANKGILVTTSHYGTDAYEFSKDKPIELVDGGGLLYLLEQAGIQARIVFPTE